LKIFLFFYEKLPVYNPQGLTKVNRAKTNHKSKKEKGVIGISTHNGGRLPDSYIQNYTGYPKQILKFSNDKGLHPTQKPIALMEYLIKTYTNEGETVLDFTMGSGTTGVACVNTGRDFIGIELDEGYFNLAKNRIKEAQSQGRLF
jgi:DNA modification methylase